jgi:hypothetical protein
MMAATGCSDDEASAPPPPPPPPPPGPVDCADHERASGDACIPVGVTACAMGFESDGRGGCDPLLPDTVCPDGLMATPGETTCREVAPCAAGKYGDIPTDSSTQHVDGSYAGMDSDGSETKPWTTIQAGADAAMPNAIVAIAAGSYRESVLIDGKAVQLWGKCPAEVEVVGATGVSTIAIFHAAGAEIHTLAARGGSVGLDVWDVSGIVDRVWVHDTDSHALVIESAYEDNTDVQVVGSLFERGKLHSVRLVGGRATLTQSVVRSTQPEQGQAGIGVFAKHHIVASAAAHVELHSSLVEESRDVGVFVFSASAHIEASVIRNTTPDEQGVFGRGLDVEVDPEAGEPAAVTLQGSVIANNHDVGLFSAGASVVMDSTVVRDTLPGIDGRLGRGVHFRNRPETGSRGSATISNSLVERNFDVGLYLAASDVSLTASLIRDTKPRADNLFGDGISVFGKEENIGTVAPARLDIDGSLITNNARSGISCFGAMVSMAHNALHCNSLQLDGEVSGVYDFEFEDRGDNLCSCGEEVGACRVVSTTHQTPDPND